MTDDPTEKPLLEPARYEEPEIERSFAPRIPWLWIGVAPLLLAAAVGGYLYREHGKENDLRAALHARYATAVAAPGAPVLAFRRRLEGLALARRSEPTALSHVDPRLRLSALHGVPGIYLRVREADLETPEKLAEAALGMEPDAVTRCLGIAPVSARVLYERGAFLDPAWDRKADAANGLLELRVLEDQLERHIGRDLPILEGAIRSEYFLLMVVRGEQRADSPVDVYLFDVHAGSSIVALAARIRARGALVPVRAVFEGTPGGPRLPAGALDRSGAVDCSIASQLKTLAGEPTMDFHSPLDRPAADAGVASEPVAEPDRSLSREAGEVR